MTCDIENAFSTISITKSEDISTTYIRKTTSKSNNVSMELTNVTVCKGKSVKKQSTLPEIKTPTLFHPRKTSLPFLK